MLVLAIQFSRTRNTNNLALTAPDYVLRLLCGLAAGRDIWCM